jgi:hypothetical protein
MDDRELVIRTGSLTKRSGRVLALDGMSLDAFPALLASSWPATSRARP